MLDEDTVWAKDLLYKSKIVAVRKGCFSIRRMLNSGRSELGKKGVSILGQQRISPKWVIDVLD